MTDVALAGINSFALGSPTPDSLDEILLEHHLLNNKIAIFREENDKLKSQITADSRDSKYQDSNIIII